MNHPDFGWPLVRLDSTESTMTDALQLARAGACHGTVVVAGVQTDGRGRGNRIWTTPPGTALLMSVILYPNLEPAALSPLSLLSALAIAEMLQDLDIPDVRIKWPNDVQVGGRKVSGVLLRAHALAAITNPVVILGIGLNVNVPMDELPETGTSMGIALGRRLDIDAIRLDVLGRLHDLVEEVQDGCFAASWERLQTLLAYRGEQVQVVDGERVMIGTIVDLDRTGGLVLSDETGRLLTIVSGDLTRGPRPFLGDSIQ